MAAANRHTRRVAPRDSPVRVVLAPAALVIQAFPVLAALARVVPVPVDRAALAQVVPAAPDPVVPAAPVPVDPVVLAPVDPAVLVVLAPVVLAILVVPSYRLRLRHRRLPVPAATPAMARPARCS